MTTAATDFSETTLRSAAWRPKTDAAGLRRAAVAVTGGVVWASFAWITARWPDVGDWGRGEEFALFAAALALVLVVGGLAGLVSPAVDAKLARRAPWALALGIFFAVWQVVAGKSHVLPQPFFPPPHAILEVFVDDHGKLVEGTIASLKLELLGFAFGAAAGFVIGVALGWSRLFGYWVHPIMRLIGPVPSIAWLPMVFFVFPSSWSASVFLIALTTGFPVAVLTWSGVASVDKAYYDVARTLGAKPAFLVFKVAIPAALPHVFVGLFMGLSASFAVLVIAEMMGVKAGLGFYLQWAQGWASYANMYAALLVMSLMCSSFITALFKIRDRLLSYEKAKVQW